ncbi:MAG: Regulatory protein LuxO [Phycisphaerae bacterium]|nr:Regulatory protein LuxO [Phycisphaerae bacterium]
MTLSRTILIVEPDVEIAGMLTDHLQQTTEARVLHVTRAADAIRLDLESTPDLLLSELRLPDGYGLDLVRLLRSSREYPVMVMGESATMGKAVEALRLGVRDLFIKPFDLQRLTTSIKAALVEVAEREQKDRRLQRLENLVSRVLDERKDLQQRMDLVCKDLVQAYQDLAERFVSSRTSA